MRRRLAVRYAHQSENCPVRIIGPIARAGLTPAPLTGPLITMATARAAPIAMAAMPRGTRVSGGHCHDHQDQHEGDNGFGCEDPPRGNPGGRAVAPRRAIDRA